MTTNASGSLIAFRADRLGGRLISLLNTMRIARSFDLPFVVHWRDSDGLDDPREIFADAFVDGFFVDKPTFVAMRNRATPIGSLVYSTTQDVFLSHLENEWNVVVDPVFGSLKLPFENEAEVKKVFDQVVEDLPLNPELAIRLAEIRDLFDDGLETIAYHIRRGDLTTDRRAMNRAYPNKFVPDEYFETHMRANLDGGNARIILFSDNQAVVDRYTAQFPELQVFSQFARTDGLSPSQRDALELFAMSLADKIIAPPSSAFSSTAHTIGRGSFFDVESQLNPEEKATALNLLTKRLKQQPESFGNEGEVGQNLVHAQNHLLENGRRSEFIDLARGYIENGMNISFIQAAAFREMFLAQQYNEICQLRKEVDRGFVVALRSFAQVAFFHGCALLMLNRKEEAVEHITSAFWHEPVEGEINTLIGMLYAQGDLNRSNFWFSDPLAERFFSNRHALEHINRFFQPALDAGVLKPSTHLVSSRLFVWEWPNFTLHDSCAQYRYKGHFRSALKSLLRHSGDRERQSYLDSLTGMIWLREGDMKEAEAKLCSAIKANPDQSIFRKRMAELHDAQNDPKVAISHLDAAINMEPEAAMYRALKARILLKTKKPDEAAHILDTMLSDKGPKFPSLFFLAADSHLAAGQPDQAAAMLVEGLRLAPMNWRRQRDLAKLLVKMGNKSQAAKILRWTLQWADEHPPLTVMLSDLLAQDGRKQEACDLLKDAMLRYPDKKQFGNRYKKIMKST